MSTSTPKFAIGDIVEWGGDEHFRSPLWTEWLQENYGDKWRGYFEVVGISDGGVSVKSINSGEIFWRSKASAIGYYWSDDCFARVDNKFLFRVLQIYAGK